MERRRIATSFKARVIGSAVNIEAQVVQPSANRVVGNAGPEFRASMGPDVSKHRHEGRMQLTVKLHASYLDNPCVLLVVKLPTKRRLYCRYVLAHPDFVYGAVLLERDADEFDDFVVSVRCFHSVFLVKQFWSLRSHWQSCVRRKCACDRGLSFGHNFIGKRNCVINGWFVCALRFSFLGG